MINSKRDRKNLLARLGKKSVLKDLDPLLRSGAYILRPGDGKLVPRFPSLAWDTPWVHANYISDARCDIYHRVFFNIMKHIPTYCRECYKVVIRPKNLVELFDLYELQRDMDVAAKCGIEPRDSVNGLYGGYFYNRGLEAGRVRYKEVRRRVSRRLSPETPVILKRYCTEFEIGELGQGPSNRIGDTTSEEKEREAYILDLFPEIGLVTPQPEHVIAATMIKWIRWAYSNGDQTYLEFTAGKPLAEKYVTYHEED